MADVGAPMAERGTSIDTVAGLFGKTGAFPAGPGARVDGVGIAFDTVGAIVDEAGAVFEELSAGAAGVVARLGAVGVSIRGRGRPFAGCARPIDLFRLSARQLFVRAVGAGIADPRFVEFPQFRKRPFDADQRVVQMIVVFPGDGFASLERAQVNVSLNRQRSDGLRQSMH